MLNRGFIVKSAAVIVACALEVNSSVVIPGSFVKDGFASDALFASKEKGLKDVIKMEEQHLQDLRKVNEICCDLSKLDSVLEQQESEIRKIRGRLKRTCSVIQMRFGNQSWDIPLKKSESTASDALKGGGRSSGDETHRVAERLEMVLDNGRIQLVERKEISVESIAELEKGSIEVNVDIPVTMRIALAKVESDNAQIRKQQIIGIAKDVLARAQIKGDIDEQINFIRRCYKEKIKNMSGADLTAAAQLVYALVNAKESVRSVSNEELNKIFSYMDSQ